MSANKTGVESCVETPAAPEWLSKLESRREKLTKSKKLGHESGAGAPCNVCGEYFDRLLADNCTWALVVLMNWLLFLGLT